MALGFGWLPRALATVAVGAASLGAAGAAAGTAHADTPVPDSIVLSPVSASIASGGTQEYTAEGYSEDGTDLGDVTGETTFTVADGSCTANSCSAVDSGDHLVTGTDGSATATATLTVDAPATPQQPAAQAPTARITIAPAAEFVTAGEALDYHAEAYDAQGDDQGDVTDRTTFSLQNGSCNANLCETTVATLPFGAATTVTGTFGSVTGTTTLTVYPAQLSFLTLAAGKVGKSGQKIAFTAVGYDRYGNSVGEETPATTLRISPDGSCGATTCTPAKGGRHVVTATIATPSGTTSAQTALDAGFGAPTLSRTKLTTSATGATAAYSVDGHGAGTVTTVLTASARGHATVTARTTKDSGSLAVRDLAKGVRYAFTLTASTPKGGSSKVTLAAPVAKTDPGKASVSLLISAAKVKKGGALSLSGAVVGTVPVSGLTVQLWQTLPGRSAVQVATAKTNGKGAYAFMLHPKQTAAYSVIVRLPNLTLSTTPGRVTVQ